jgi:hypothetical protein
VGRQSNFERFLADEAPAIDQLRRFAGGQLGPLLDGSLESLGFLDRYIQSLTQHQGWESDSLFAAYSSNIRPWLTVRLAYYLADVIKRGLGGKWRMEREEPVLDLESLHISPLEIAHAYLDGVVDGGLAGLYADLAINLAERDGRRE